MSSNVFSLQLRKLCEAAKSDMETVARKTAIQLQTGMIQLSPVDTGRFRANWVCGIGAVNPSTSQSTDKTGGIAVQQTIAALEAWAPGKTIWLTNNLPYAVRLENGYSDQAPNGMVALTVQSFKDYVQRAIGEVKK